MRGFLVSCPPSGPSPPVAELVIATVDFQRDLCSWNIMPVKGGVDAKELFHSYITRWIQDKRLALLESCKLEKVKWSGVRTKHSTAPFIDELHDRLKEMLNGYEIIIRHWPEYATVLENAFADVERATVETLDKQYADVLSPLKDNLTTKILGLKYVQKIAKGTVNAYCVPDELGILLNSMKRMLDTLWLQIETQFKSWSSWIAECRNAVAGEHLSEITVMMRAKFRNYLLAVVEKLVENVTEQDMEDTYQPPFRSCIEEGKASCLMCSYNQVNGVPACLREDLFQKARNEWGFKGYITSDCDAVATIQFYQNYTKTPEDAAADVLKAGMDSNCGTFMLRHTESAILKGKLREEEIDKALFNLFTVQLRLGLFDGNPRSGKFGKLGPQDVCTSEHRALALEAAKQGIVLLKNDKRFLPLNKNAVSSLAIIGPLANNASQMGGGYSGVPCIPKSHFEGLQDYIKKTSYASGCSDVPCNSDAGFNEAIHTAKEADFVIVIAGLDLTQETEDLDRVSLLLPGQQMALVSSVAAASKRPVVLVLTGGGPIDVSFAKADPRISSIIWIGYPGEAGAEALAEIIFGDFNPGGRLPMTWYPQSFTKVPMTDMNMRADPSRGYPGRTYRFYTGNRVYGFGEGLSYTNYSYKILSAPSKLSVTRSFKASSSKNILQQGARLDYIHINEVTSCFSLKFSVQISVTNVGDMDGSHPVLLFTRMPRVFQGTPEKHLIGFDCVHTISNRSKEISILVDPCKHLSIANEHGNRILPLGNHVLMLGDLEHLLQLKVTEDIKN